MSRIRFGMFITMLLGSIYAAAGLMTSLRDFGIGMAVAGTAVLGWGLCEWMEDR